MLPRAGPSELQYRGPGRQGGRRKQGARARRTCIDGPRAAAKTDHDQSLAGRPAQGRLALRPARGARRAGGDGHYRCRAAGGLGRGGRTGPRRARRAVARRPVGSAPCKRGGKGPHLSRSARGRGEMGERGAGPCRTRPRQPAQPFEGHRPACRTRSRPCRRARALHRSQAGQGSGNRQARIGDRSGGRAQSADGRPSGRWQIADGELPSRHIARTDPGRGAGSEHGAIGGRHPRRRAHQPGAPVPRAAPFGEHGGTYRGADCG